MSESPAPIQSLGKAKFNQFKQQNKQNYSFFFGVFINRWAKKYITLEHIHSSNYFFNCKGPWSGIIAGVVMGSILHTYTWRKRLMIENFCVREELSERANTERGLKTLKSGSDIENLMIMNYLKTEDRI